jgi:hypothetical protein
MDDADARAEYAEMVGVAEEWRWLRDELPWRKCVLVGTSAQIVGSETIRTKSQI